MTENEAVLEEEHFQRVLQAFASHYSHCQEGILGKYRRDYQRLSVEHQAFIPKYFAKIEKAEECCRKNQEFYNHVISTHSEQLDTLADEAVVKDGSLVTFSPRIRLTLTESENLRSLLRTVMRDWSAEGAQERQKCYNPVLEVLQAIFPIDERCKIRVLVPGAGLGRLAYEISQLGFVCEGNEFSLFMLLTAELFLTRSLIPGSYEIHPFTLPFSNTIKVEEQFRGITVPDIEVHSAPAEFSMIAGDFLDVYGDEKEAGRWNAISSCYFIDTAQDIIGYIRLFYKLLVPGGVWINLGPLLYHFEGHASEPSIELSVEEVRALAEKVGFVFDKKEEEEEEFLDSSYAQNLYSMNQTVYRCWFFTARKPQLS